MFMRMIYDEGLAQAAYLIGCQRTGEAIVFDPERDVDRYVDLATANGLRIVATAETHIHADFLSGSRELAESLGATVYVSDEGGADWRYEWLDRRAGGGAYDHQLLRDGDVFSIGNIEFTVMHTPGHTPEHISFLVTDRGTGATAPMGMITGDFVFVGDLGRPDLLETAAGQVGAMEPAARRLFESVGRLRDVAEFVQVWPAHGSGSACGKSLGAVPSSTIGFERRFNPAIRASSSEAEFVAYILAGQPEPPLYFGRMKRDNKVGPPVLGTLPRPAPMSAAALAALDGRRVAIIDARPWAAFRSGHVPRALSVPRNRGFTTNVGSIVRADEPVYLIIDPAHVDGAVRDLVRIGLDRIEGWYDASAMEGYERAGHPVATVPEVTVEDAADLIDDRSVQVLDVRRATEFADGHLPHAMNIAHTRLASRLAEVPRDRRLLVNCRSGVRSALASAYLQREGYQVANLRGGMLAWEQALATVER
jgi:hydroxyacylglutathione hydrolase